MSLVEHLMTTRTPLALAKELAAEAKKNADLQRRVHELEVQQFWLTRPAPTPMPPEDSLYHEPADITHAHSHSSAHGISGAGKHWPGGRGGISKASGAGAFGVVGYGGGGSGLESYGGGGSSRIPSSTHGTTTLGYAGNVDDGESKSYWKARALLAERELATLKVAT